MDLSTRQCSAAPAQIASGFVNPPNITFAQLDRRRRALGIPVGRWIAAAGMDPRTFRRAKSGAGYQRTDKLGRLSRALDALAAGAPQKDTLIRASIASAELALRLELARSRRLMRACAGRCREIPAARLRRFAIYLVTVELLIANADVARALGDARQNVKQARDQIDDLRDHPLVDAMLDRLAAILKGER